MKAYLDSTRFFVSCNFPRDAIDDDFVLVDIHFPDERYDGLRNGIVMRL
jgi:hypothetical protein